MTSAVLQPKDQPARPRYAYDRAPLSIYQAHKPRLHLVMQGNSPETLCGLPTDYPSALYHHLDAWRRPWSPRCSKCVRYALKQWGEGGV